MMVELHLGDCLEIMPTLEDNSVDVVITDPPYPGLKGGVQHLKGGVAKTKYESQSIGDLWNANLDWIEDAWRISRFGMMVFCSYHSVDLVKEKLRDYAVGLVTWYKRNSPNPVNNVPKFSTEFIWLFKKQPGLKWRNLKTFYDIPKLAAGCFASERILQSGNGKALHPTQKPILLMKQLLKADPTSILDPFLGTGTTGVACVQTGRNFIGIEIEPKYYEIAEKRIAEAQLQIRMPI